MKSLRINSNTSETTCKNCYCRELGWSQRPCSVCLEIRVRKGGLYSNERPLWHCGVLSKDGLKMRDNKL